MLSIDQRDTKKFSYHPDNGPMRYYKIPNHPSNGPLRYEKNPYIILTMDKCDTKKYSHIILVMDQ